MPTTTNVKPRTGPIREMRHFGVLGIEIRYFNIHGPFSIYFWFLWFLALKLLPRPDTDKKNSNFRFKISGSKQIHTLNIIIQFISTHIFPHPFHPTSYIHMVYAQEGC